MRSFIGTSGFSYKEWKPAFYPAKLPQRAWLEHYSGRLASVELNGTFYRMPSPETCASWREQTPNGFHFSLKSSRRITHLGKLVGQKDAVSAFFQRIDPLGEKLGPVLFQLPASFRADAAVLRDFLDDVPHGKRIAFEFRHQSWFTDEIRQMLADRNAALCHSEADDATTPGPLAICRTAYLRLRRTAYGEEDLARWRNRLEALAPQVDEVFLYFKHEGDSPAHAWAERLQADLGKLAPSPSPAPVL